MHVCMYVCMHVNMYVSHSYVSRPPFHCFFFICMYVCIYPWPILWLCGRMNVFRWVMSRMRMGMTTLTMRLPQMEWIMSHLWMRHVTLENESCHEPVESRLSHDTLQNESNESCHEPGGAFGACRICAHFHRMIQLPGSVQLPCDSVVQVKYICSKNIYTYIYLYTYLCIFKYIYIYIYINNIYMCVVYVHKYKNIFTCVDKWTAVFDISK